MSTLLIISLPLLPLLRLPWSSPTTEKIHSQPDCERAGLFLPDASVLEP